MKKAAIRPRKVKSKRRAVSTTKFQEFAVDIWFSGDELLKHDTRELFICATGLAGECGEVQEILKKYVRDGKVPDENLKKELGDVLYYLTIIAHAFGYSLDDVIRANMAKLNGRLKRGTLRGSGNDR